MTQKDKPIVVRCERCNCAIHPDLIVWMELSVTDGRYYKPDKFPQGHKSQGLFAFGNSCAEKINENEYDASEFRYRADHYRGG